MSLTQLQQLITDDIQHYQLLQQILMQEQEALKLCQAEPIKELLKRKTTLLTQAQQNANLRSKIMTGMQFEANESGFTRLLSCLTDQKQANQLREDWNLLQGLLKECQTHNSVNGKILQRTQQTVKRFLGIYRGQEQSGASLYNRSGNLSNRASQYCLAQA